MAFEGFTNEGAAVSIGTTTAASTESEFDADTYTSVGTFETVPEIGSNSTVNTANPVNMDEVSRKGTRTFPETTLALLYEPGSDGLTALQAAEQSRDEYNFKIEYPDEVGGSPTNGTTHYFRVLVTAVTFPGGGVNDFARVNVGMKLVSQVVIKDAA